MRREPPFPEKNLSNSYQSNSLDEVTIDEWFFVVVYRVVQAYVSTTSLISINLECEATMAVSILPYSLEYYNSLPDLLEARERFQSARASDFLFIEIGQLLVHHGVENVIGVVLLHNHFPLEQHEMLVTFGSVTVPVATPLPDVGASSWRFVKGGIAPYEFIQPATKMSLNGQMESFLIEFRALLEKLGLTDILGICFLKPGSLNEPATTEFSAGRANITLDFDLAPDDDDVVDAMWRFSSVPLSPSDRVRSAAQGMPTFELPL